MEEKDNRNTEPERNWKAIGIGIVLVAAVVALIVLLSRSTGPALKVSDPNQPSTADPYAANLPLTEVKMSSADIGTGAQIYYVTGKITNTGTKTVSGARVELVFRDTLGKICQRNVEPLRVVVATEPALDTADLAHLPFKPGQSRDFQIPIEHISAEWDGQYPALTLVQVTAQ